MSFCRDCGGVPEAGECVCEDDQVVIPPNEPDLMQAVIKGIDPRGRLDLELKRVQGPPFVMVAGQLLEHGVDYESVGGALVDGGAISFTKALTVPLMNEPHPVLVIDYDVEGLLRIATYRPRRRPSPVDDLKCTGCDGDYDGGAICENCACRHEMEE